MQAQVNVSIYTSVYMCAICMYALCMHMYVDYVCAHACAHAHVFGYMCVCVQCLCMYVCLCVCVGMCSACVYVDEGEFSLVQHLWRVVMVDRELSG